MPHQLRTDLRTGRDHTPVLAPQGLPYIHSFRTFLCKVLDDVPDAQESDYAFLHGFGTD